MQLIIKDGKIVATHEDHQVVADKYSGCECISWNKPLPDHKLDSDGFPMDQDDPRSAEEKTDTYRDERRVAYPSVEDQLDMIYHDTVDGTTTWTDSITTVKNAHPKT